MPALEPTEEQIQRAILDWVAIAWPECRVAAIPNGYRLSPAMAGKRKREGLSKGAPDLVVALPGGKTLWVECKSRRGALTIEQRDWRESLLRLGHHHVVARSIEDVIAAAGQHQ